MSHITNHCAMKKINIEHAQRPNEKNQENHTNNKNANELARGIS